MAFAAKHFGKDPYELYNQHRRVRYCPVCGRTRTPGLGEDRVFCNGPADERHPPRAWELAPLPPHPRPRFYRNLLLAMANWVEGEQMTVDAMKIQAASLGTVTVKALTGGK